MPQTAPPETPLHCPKCNGEMLQGYVVDDSYSMRFIAVWSPGKPRRSFWSGTEIRVGALPIGTFRCASCGYLESYARKEFAAE